MSSSFNSTCRDCNDWLEEERRDGWKGTCTRNGIGRNADSARCQHMDPIIPVRELD